MHYSQGVEIKANPRTVWMIEFENGARKVTVWGPEAKIEDVVNFIKRTGGGQKFTVRPVDIGEFWLNSTEFEYFNTLKLDQDLCYQM